jgi:heteromeric Ino2p/Ino4p transcription factor
VYREFIKMSKDETGSGGESQTASPASEQTPTSTAKFGSKRAKTSKPRLSASQKNFNHKDAENKRRTAIRERFTELSHLVPGAEGQEKSEQVMLNKTADYLKELLEEQARLEQLAKDKGITIDAGEPLKPTDYGQPEWKQKHMEQYEAAKRKRESGGGAQQDDGEYD